MEKIMIVSDTHRKLGNLAAALSEEKDINKLIHLGDFEGDDEIIKEMTPCEVIIVPGNNDYLAPYDKEIEMEIAGKKVLLTHGHYYYVSLDLQTIRDEGKGRGMDIVMFGHTHRPVIIEEDDITLINPGSISYPRQADKKFTYIIMTIDENDKISYELKCV